MKQPRGELMLSSGRIPLLPMLGTRDGLYLIDIEGSGDADINQDRAACEAAEELAQTFGRAALSCRSAGMQPIVTVNSTARRVTAAPPSMQQLQHRARRAARIRKASTCGLYTYRLESMPECSPEEETSGYSASASLSSSANIREPSPSAPLPTCCQPTMLSPSSPTSAHLFTYSSVSDRTASAVAEQQASLELRYGSSLL